MGGGHFGFGADIFTVGSDTTPTETTTYTFEATEQLVIDATTTPHTDTTGVFKMDVEAAASTVSSFALNHEHNSAGNTTATRHMKIYTPKTSCSSPRISHMSFSSISTVHAFMSIATRVVICCLKPIILLPSG